MVIVFSEYHKKEGFLKDYTAIAKAWEGFIKQKSRIQYSTPWGSKYKSATTIHDSLDIISHIFKDAGIYCSTIGLSEKK